MLVILGSFFLFWFLLFFIGTIIWIWALIDVVKNRRLDDTNKILWFLIVLFLHLIGAIVYIFAGRSGEKMINSKRKH